MLVQGRMYTAMDDWACPCGRSWYAIEEVLRTGGFIARPKLFACRTCKREILMQLGPYEIFLQKRFLPYKPDKFGVDEKEVTDLNTPKVPDPDFERYMNHLWEKVKP